jgi:adenylosuccinate lyase
MSSSLFAISPIDGRYQKKLEALETVASEFGLISYRVRVEAHWLLHLCDLKELGLHEHLTPRLRQTLEDLSGGLAQEAATAIKRIEAETNHDVKAVEYFLRETLLECGADDKLLSHIHFGCTSEDINNVAYGMMLNDLRSLHIGPAMRSTCMVLTKMVQQYAAQPMLSRTHGQSASPTTLGKELAVFAWRLSRCLEQLERVPILAKFNGAVGNYNAHNIAYPGISWPDVCAQFIEQRLGLKQNPWTTQIENHDSLVEYFDILRRYAVIATGLCRDMWGYISLGYFRLRKVEKEVGSSTMPHKVNPIDFENAEGNFGLSTSLCQYFAEKLPISRWQRDLSDSTVLRNIGTAAAYWLVADQSLRKGLDKVSADAERLEADLNASSEILTEAVQSVLRAAGVVDAYEQMKELSRGQSLTLEALRRWVDECSILNSDAQSRLQSLSASSYTGLAAELANQWVEFMKENHKEDRHS